MQNNSKKNDSKKKKIFLPTKIPNESESRDKVIFIIDMLSPVRFVMISIQGSYHQEKKLFFNP